MNDYNNYDYGFNDSGFIGIPKQITDEIKDMKVSQSSGMEEIKDTIENQAYIQHQDALAIKQEQEDTRNSLTGLFGALAQTFKNIFTKDKGDIQEETFYEMVQRENNETQAYMQAHTQTMKEESDQTQEIMSADTENLVEAIRNETINSGSF